VATETVYVPEFLDEGVEVWAPVEATVEAGGVFRLPDQTHGNEASRFPPGSRVRCDLRLLASHCEALVACESVG
jgi:hypothetical protein